MWQCVMLCVMMCGVLLFGHVMKRASEREREGEGGEREEKRE